MIERIVNFAAFESTSGDPPSDNEGENKSRA